MSETVAISLRRTENTQPWGFRLRGGTDQGIPLHVEHVGPKGRAAQAGLQAGDLILSICRADISRHTHAQVKQEILRAGNEIDFLVQREGGSSAPPPPKPTPAAPEEPRVQICEEPTVKMGGPVYKDIRSKTFQVLDKELAPEPAPAEPAHAPGGPAPPSQPAPAGPRPASIFDRKKQERSAYLHAHGSSIQKAYGEKK